MERATLFEGDSREILAELDTASVDSIVADPPAGIGFMGAAWDRDKGGRLAWIAWLAGLLEEARRVVKPGGWALLWALPRTSHWTATALEEGGWVIRDVLTHVQGQGFPKSLNLEGGKGTALKPASEHWILARSPLGEKTVAANVARWGVGALEIDRSRIPLEAGASLVRPAIAREEGSTLFPGLGVGAQEEPEGRWPPNFLLSHAPACGLEECSPLCPVEELDRQAGGERLIVDGSAAWNGKGIGYQGGAAPGREWAPRPPARAGASSFFPSFRWDKDLDFPFLYAAKASREERERGCEALPLRSPGEVTGGRKEGSAGLSSPRAGAGRTAGARNFHPTIKSLALMRWLVRLITPPRGTVLDPFMGSGTTGAAACGEGFRFVGIEREAGYLEIARARIAYTVGALFSGEVARGERREERAAAAATLL